MLHIDDPERIRRYGEWLSQSQPPTPQDERDRRLVEMLHFDLWSSETERANLGSSLERFWSNPLLVEELREVLSILGEQTSRISFDAGIEAEIPLLIHARYSRNEILAALGEATAERPVTWREGVKFVQRYNTDVFLITLNKSDRLFSPTTRYRDYPISPRCFHWESQSTTTISSRSGQRYINHEQGGGHVWLFARESSVGDAIGASPFLFLGPAKYVSHRGERPMQIIWDLDFEMPPDFFQIARVAA